jgi:exopolysaccharide biosynthesis polyprenyl glycosylphosphotransferase
LSSDHYSSPTSLFQQTHSGRPVAGRLSPGTGFSLLAAFGEAAIIARAVAAALLLFRSTSSLGWASWVALIGLPLSTVAILAQRQFYAAHNLLFARFQPLRLTGAWIGAFATTIVLATLARSIEPVRLHEIGMVPPELAVLFGAGLGALFAGRVAWAVVRPRFAIHAVPRVLFIGALDASRRLLAQLHEEDTIHLVATLDYRDDTIARSATADLASVEPTLSGHDRLAAMLEREAIDAILIALPHTPQDATAAIAAAAQSCGVTTVALPGLSLRRNPAAGFTTLGGVPVLQRETTGLPPGFMVQKRLFDLLLGGLVLLVIAPVMAIIAVLIRLDSPGPVLFRQLRVGRGGALFEILKFRTMHHQVPRDPGQDHGAVPDQLQTARNDRRITRLGAVLRRHSLDELPQIFNVLRGDMSIIGPRPHAADMTVEGMRLEALVPDYTARFAVPPGITGWAQINGRRGILDTAIALQNRVDHDLYYIENWSLGFDVSILLRTILCVIRDDQAF